MKRHNRNRLRLPRIHCAACFFLAYFLAGSLLSVSEAAAENNPLSPTNTLQIPGLPFPYSIFYPDDYVAAPVPSAYDVLIASTSFAANGSYLGATVISSVYQDPSNGYLAFAYQIKNTSTAINDIERATINGVNNPWTPFTIFDAGSDGTGVSDPAAGTVTWTNGNPYYIQQDAGDYGIAVQFDNGGYGTVLLSQTSDSSATIWLATNAQNYGLAVDGIGLHDTTAEGESNAYVPAGGTLAAVPEPSTIVTSLIGLGIAIAGWRRRSRRPSVQPLESGLCAA
jgi:hypothetical protein